MMKILIVNPTSLDEFDRPKKYKKAYIPPLIFGILSSLTPKHHHVHCVNDIAEHIDFSGSYDLVAISTMTCQAERAYQIADAFRKKNIKVIIGGIHASIVPEEAKEHADAVAIGEADNIWEQILDDCEQNKLKEFYQEDAFPDLKKLIIPRWDNVQLSSYPKRPGKKYPIICMYTSRGCPMGCSFCSVTKYFGSTFRTRPVEHVLQEIDAIDANDYLFVDDNIIFNADYSRELFAALSKRNIHWMGQFSTRVLKNPELIESAARSGCYDAFIGMESINKDSLAGVKKSFNKTEEYEELFKRLKYSGIMPTVSIILGFDEDDADQFRLLLEFLRKNRIFYAIFFILTPPPGTVLYENMSQEGRILHRNWSLYNGTNVVFRPKKFTEAGLLDEYWKVFQEFYSMKNIYRHLVDSLNVRNKRASAFADNLVFQFYFRYMVNRRVHPYSCFGKRIHELTA